MSYGSLEMIIHHLQNLLKQSGISDDTIEKYLNENGYCMECNNELDEPEDNCECPAHNKYIEEQRQMNKKLLKDKGIWCDKCDKYLQDCICEKSGIERSLDKYKLDESI